MNPQIDHPIRDLLAQRVQGGADAVDIAEAVASTWEAIALSMRPIVGQRGVAALYGRCVHLAARQHPWLSGLHDGVSVDPDVVSLSAVLARQPVAACIEGGAALLQTLQELLVSLLGQSLTDQLLDAAWTHLSGGRPAQDNS